jgi:hypothetical protein
MDTGTIKGRGVFAGRAFLKDELVEVAPVIVITACVLPRIIADVLYNWASAPDAPKRHAVALGYGSIYNHENPSNLSYTADVKLDLIRYWARREIAPNEELTINYNAPIGHCSPGDDNWFERHGIKRLLDLSND